MELVFESAHQPLKRCVRNSNYRDAHLSAVEHVLGNDWQGRLSVLYNDADTPGRDGEYAKLGFIRFLMGEEVWRCVHEGGRQDITEEIMAVIEKCFVPPVLLELQADGKSKMFQARNGAVWVGSEVCKFDALHIMGGRLRASSAMKRAANLLDTLRPTFEADQSVRWLKVGKRMRLDYHGKTKGIGRAYDHDKVSFGNVVQVLATQEKRNSKIVEGGDASVNGTTLFAVIGFIERSGENKLWAVVLRCTFGTYRCRRVVQLPKTLDSAESIQVLEMGKSVRRVGLTHLCVLDGPCEVSVHDRKVTHGNHLLDGGRYLIQTRKDGYPPRMA